MIDPRASPSMNNRNASLIIVYLSPMVTFTRDTAPGPP